MAWCDQCDHLVEDDDLTGDGACPTCGTVLTEPVHRPVPWYFKVMIPATAVYLVWRIYQGVSWLAHHA